MGNYGKYVGADLAPLGDAAMEIKLTATTAHLIFEEVMAGDTSENVQHVWDLLDETIWYCDAILNGASNDEGIFVATDDPRVQEKIREVKRSVQGFIQSARDRYSQRVGSVTTGSEVDQAFDESYEKLQEGLNRIMTSLNQQQNIEIVRLAGNAKYMLANGHLFF